MDPRKKRKGKPRQGKRIGKSKPGKADNQRNRIVGRDVATCFRITDDGHFVRL